MVSSSPACTRLFCNRAIFSAVCSARAISKTSAWPIACGGPALLLEQVHNKCRRGRNDFGVLPLPAGERVGVRGLYRTREALTPHPTPLPMGEGADRACGPLMIKRRNSSHGQTALQ